MLMVQRGVLQKLWLEIGRFAIALSANQHSGSEKVKYNIVFFCFGISVFFGENMFDLSFN